LPAHVFPIPSAGAVGGGMLVCGLDWQCLFVGRLLAFVGSPYRPVLVNAGIKTIQGRTLMSPSERRIHPAATRAIACLPDKSGVPRRRFVWCPAFRRS